MKFRFRIDFTISHSIQTQVKKIQQGMLSIQNIPCDLFLYILVYTCLHNNCLLYNSGHKSLLNSSYIKYCPDSTIHANSMILLAQESNVNSSYSFHFLLHNFEDMRMFPQPHNRNYHWLSNSPLHCKPLHIPLCLLHVKYMKMYNPALI